MSSFSNIVFIVIGKRRRFIDLNQDGESLVEFPSKNVWLYPIFINLVKVKTQILKSSKRVATKPLFYFDLSYKVVHE